MMLQSWLLIACLSMAQAAPVTYQEVRKFVLGGEGGWDYLISDPATSQLFITRSTRVQLVDPLTGKQTAELAGTDGVHGVALASDLKRIFTSNGKLGTVGVFDLITHQPIGQVKVGQNPDAILYDQKSAQVFAFNGKSHDVSVINAPTLKVVRTVPLGGKPEFAGSDEQGHVFVNIEDTSEVLQLDAQTGKILSRWKLKPCDDPTGLAVEATGKMLYVGCSNKLLAVVDARSGVVRQTLPVGEGVDAVAADHRSGLIFVSAGEGRLSVFSPASGGRIELAQDVPTAKGARTLAINEQRGEVYLVSSQMGPMQEKDGHRRPSLVPGTFTLYVFATKK